MEEKQSLRLGICAMEAKIKSKHMQNILRELENFEFELIIFSDKIIFNEEVENWPIVDALIIFFSSGFPFSKGLKYVKMRQPVLINDFEGQKVFWDRRKVYQILELNNIQTPKKIIFDRGEKIDNDGEFKKCKPNQKEIEKLIKLYHNHNPGISKKIILNDDQESKINNFSTSSLVEIEKQEGSISSKEPSTVFPKESQTGNNYQIVYSQSASSSFANLLEEKEKSEKIIFNDNMSNSSQSSSCSKPYDKEFEKEKKPEIHELIEYDDHIEYNGVKIYKPFVEKPFDGDDHAIHIYYPPNLGGGHKRLFRKTQNLCSLYIPNENFIRRDKSYIYEEFLQNDGFDIKVYTVGPEYAHAEARKSPTLDGVVRVINYLNLKRTKEGKEVRYPVNLTPFEKELARKIVNIFKQKICGFDILRSQGKSYVCDVNGWSFVKGNKKYYEDCAILIRKLILNEIDPRRLKHKEINLRILPTPLYKVLPHRPAMKEEKYEEELRSVVTVFRHADRSPKQKMKSVVTDRNILDLFDIFGKGNYNKEIKLKKPKELLKVLEISNKILDDNNINENTIYEITDTFFNKLLQLKMVLEKNLDFQGMTRKIQLKPLKWEKIKLDNNKEKTIVTEALFIFKWGGDITHSGIEQAKILGNIFRFQIYPSNEDTANGEGLLRLHSTYRHDLKCYSSDEGRCMKTAAAFLQGFLELDGNLIPIIFSMVRQDQPVLDVSGDEIADLKNKIKNELEEILHHDGELVEKFKSFFKNQRVFSKDNDSDDHSLFRLMEKINNPLKMLQNIYNLIDKLIAYIKTLLTKEELELDSSNYFIRRHAILQKRKISDYDISEFHKENEKEKDNEIKNSVNLEEVEFECEDEKIILIYKRWIKLYQDFYNKKKNRFDISKIPDVYDNIKYDIIHNKSILNDDAYNLYYCISLLANFVMPLEYGITVEEKIKIGYRVIQPLLNKIYNDLLWWLNPKSNTKEFEFENESFSGLDSLKLQSEEIKSVWRHVKTRFYFTCASHLFSLINTIIFGMDSILLDQTESNQTFIKQLKNVLDFDYLSHIVFRLYENFNVCSEDPKRFRLEIIMTPGTNNNPCEADKNHLIKVSPWIVLNKNLTLKEMEEFFTKLNCNFEKKINE